MTRAIQNCQLGLPQAEFLGVFVEQLGTKLNHLIARTSDIFRSSELSSFFSFSTSLSVMLHSSSYILSWILATSNFSSSSCTASPLTPVAFFITIALDFLPLHSILWHWKDTLSSGAGRLQHLAFLRASAVWQQPEQICCFEHRIARADQSPFCSFSRSSLNMGSEIEVNLWKALGPKTTGTMNNGRAHQTTAVRYPVSYRKVSKLHCKDYLLS